MRQELSWSRRIARIVIGSSVIVGFMVVTARDLGAEPMSVDDFSPAFLGMYRKVMEVEGDIRHHAERYGVDFDLARAVCLYESGGNAGLASHAGAQGYFQVMPGTFRELKVATNIEAGVKYLAQMIQQFGREDRAVAAYNAGPGRVGRAGGLPLETLQYVIGVSHYRTVLKQYDNEIRRHASRLHLTPVGPGDDWTTLADRIGVPEWELRLHNPFLAGRRLRAGESIAYPPETRRDLLTPATGGAEYRMRHGDNYLKVAFMLGIEIEALRAENGLWQTQTVPAGIVLRIPFSIDRASIVQTALADREMGPASGPRIVLAAAVQPNELAEPTIAALIPQRPPASVEVAAVARSAAATPRSRTTAAPAAARPAIAVVHRVKRGDTVSALARRYGTTVSAIRQANNLRGTTIQIGQSLRIPRGRAQDA